MNRRTFIKTIIGAVLTGAIAPRTFLKNLPEISKAAFKVGGNRELVNRLLSPADIAREALKLLEDSLVMDKNFARGHKWSYEARANFKKRGKLRLKINKIL